MVELIAAALSLLVLLFKEFFSATARAREENKKFVLDRAAYDALVKAALEKQLASMAKVSQGQGNGWDAADEDLKPK